MKPWWRRLLAYTRPHRGGLAATISFMLLSVGLDLLKPWPMKLLVDCVLGDQPWPRGAGWIKALAGGASPAAIAWLAGGTIALFAAGQCARLLKEWVQAGVGSRMVYDLAADLFDHLQRMSLRFLGRQPTGDLVRRVTANTGCVRELVLWVGLPATQALVTLVAMFAVMCAMNWWLAVLAGLAAGPLLWLIKKFARPMSERTYQQQRLEGEIMALAEQTLTALPVVQAFARENFEDRRFRRLARRTVQAFLRATISQLKFKVSTTAVTAVATALIMGLGGVLVVMGTLTVGSLLVFLSYLGAMYTPLETLAYLSAGFASASASARRVFEVMDVDEAVREAADAKPLPAPARGHVRIEDVTFGYESDREVLKCVSLEARPGEQVALVGPTGAGKSTLVALIPRLFDPWTGRVTFDGADVRGLKLGELRSRIALVLQEPFLLPLSAAENIAYGRPGAGRAEIEAAALAANADEFIRRLPRGYDTVIGERGVTLSGGERQRLSLARAFLKNAPVLILDEPTSAVDPQTESLLLGALERLMKGRTTLIIAHRLSTVRRADRIVVLDEGRVVETGTHEQLLAARGAYCRFHELMFGARVSETRKI